MGKNRKLSSKIRNKTRMPTRITTTQHSTASLSKSNQARERNKRHLNWEWRSKMIIFWRWQDSIHRKLLETIRKSSEVAGYKNPCTKNPHTNSEISEEEIKKTIIFTIATKKIKYLGINFPVTREWRAYILKTVRHCWKKLKKTQRNGKAFHGHGLEDLT